MFCILPSKDFREGWQEFIVQQLGVKIYRDVDWNDWWLGVIDDMRQGAPKRPFWAKDKPLSTRVREAAVVPINKNIPRSTALSKHFSSKALAAMRKGFEAMLRREYERAESEETDTALWYEETHALVESMKVAERKSMEN